MGVAPTREAYRVPSLFFLYYMYFSSLAVTPPTNINIASLRLLIPPSLPPSLSLFSPLSFLLFFWGGGGALVFGEEASPLPPPTG